MNKLRLFAILLLFVVIIQSCKKESETAVANSTAPLQANIAGSTWAPDTISTTITYNSTSKTKVFNISGQKNTRQVILTITLPNAIEGNGFNTGKFNIDSAAVMAQYNTQQKNSAGEYVFMPDGGAYPNSGDITITSIDSVKKQITGTFGFYSRTVHYDSSGNISSITSVNVYGGAFNSLPYTYTTTTN